MTDQKQQARNLYFQTELTQTQIAEMLNINRKTLYLWIKEGAWQQAKQAARHMPSILIGQMYTQFAALNDKIARREEQPYPTREEAEVMRKLVLSISQLQKRLGTPERIEEMTLLIERTMEDDLALAQQMTPYIDKHIRAMEPSLNPIASILDRYHREQKEDRELEKAIAEQVEKDNTSLSTKQVNSSSPLERPGEALWGTDGASMGNAENNETKCSSVSTQTDPAPSPKIAGWEIDARIAEIENKNPFPEETNTSTEQVNTSSPLERPGEVSLYDEITSSWQYLDNKYNISQDPHIIYRRGIYKIEPGSPLWGLRRSLF